MGNNISIRSATINDADAIGIINVKSWRTAYRGIVDDKYLDTELCEKERADRWRQGALSNPVPQTAVFVAEHKGDIIGYANIGPSRHATSSGLSEVFSIYTDPDFFGTGAGQKLFNSCLDYAKNNNFTEMQLFVLEDNKRARKFYEKMGGKAVPNSGEKIKVGNVYVQDMEYKWKL